MATFGPMVKIAVIGGGAAGFFAAIEAASHGAEVHLFEKTSHVLSKVKISGGGRCNVTHAAFEPSHLIKNYPRGGKFLKKVFEQFAVRETIDWFEKRGVDLKVEADGRMFPISDDSNTIVEALQKEALAKGVKVHLKSPISKIEPLSDRFRLHGPNQPLETDRVIVTTGGHPKLEGFGWLAALGHSIIAPVPSLFTFNTPQSAIKSFPGISMPEVMVKLEGTKLTYSGPLLITHWGISGPAVLKLSAFGANWLAEKAYQAKAHIRWHGTKSEEDYRKGIGAYKTLHPKRKVAKYPLFDLPSRLWEHFLINSGISEEFIWLDCSKKQINKLVDNLFCYIVPIEGKTTYKEEFVTAGGIELSEVDPSNLESKILPGLYFAGEVLNIDGITGGFNFQAAWSTAQIAGKHAANHHIEAV
ncbi:BaiN/RdsA family NAD(P)/FAD-dependent oxidoreductase [Pararhodonellum marinum]|uniref:NAD(P)/FAD-dependent oxidoreductase n=1 Tax=Pararhodonellum marinum TaxID=2755358 RepID=UPI001E56AA2E|nr:NAD(P)/FAD-dependent oxidoreductase [Pararhodonellum marinum]